MLVHTRILDHSDAIINTIDPSHNKHGCHNLQYCCDKAILDAPRDRVVMAFTTTKET